MEQVDFYFKQVDFSLHIYTHVAREWTFQTSCLFYFDKNVIIYFQTSQFVVSTQFSLNHA